MLYYEVAPGHAHRARWPVPLLSGFGFFRRSPPGEWRGATPLGRFLVSSCGILFDSLRGPAVVRVKGTSDDTTNATNATAATDSDPTAPRGVLVPLPAPLEPRRRSQRRRERA